MTGPAVAGDTRGLVFDIERYSTHDGPGTRTTVFLKGCYLRCAWCHNPESEDARRQLMFDAGRCIGCVACMDACTHDALYLTDDAGDRLSAAALADRRAQPQPLTGRVYDALACQRCGACVEACYPGALEMVGQRQTVEQVWQQIAPDRPFYQRSGGGVTLSGGEPLLQQRFSRELLQRCRAEGVHTALDTTAFGRWEPLASVLPFTDLVLLDLKAMDADVHRRWTGVDNGSILANARRLATLLRDQRAVNETEAYGLWVRMPLIPGINATAEQVQAAAHFIRTELEGAVRVVELLGYHTLGGDKRQRLGLPQALPGTAPMAPEALRRQGEAMGQLLQGCGITVRWR
ncbi:MAG: glycyl-radical enzyme activating protein [bacterium]|nr:glycyl-radical enzyme activating protein [bacterium]